jgi:proteasome lid subunit RPN8/RPN11
MPQETGGILVGYYENGNVIVERVLVVQPERPESANYTRNSARAQTALKSLLDQAPSGAWGYVGEWHSHPQVVGPSSIDRKSLARITRRNGDVTALVVHAPNDTFWGLVGSPSRFRPKIEEAQVRNLLNDIHQRLGSLPTHAIDRNGPVFISYRHSDGSERADSLETLLHAAGLVVWRDIRDVRPGTIEDRLEVALSDGLSGAVLIVTPDVRKSDVVREREAPRLIELDEHPDFSLAIANEIPSPRNPDQPDFSAADRILGFAPDAILTDKKQVFSRLLKERLVIVNDLVRHRLEVRRGDTSSSVTMLDVAVQTRPPTSAHDRHNGSDLDIRVNAADTSRKGLSLVSRLALKATLPIVSDAAFSVAPHGISIHGGAHLSAAIAFGATFPPTRFEPVVVTDHRGQVWRSDDTGARSPLTEPPDLVGTQLNGPIAVGLFMGPGADTAVFAELVTTLGVEYFKTFQFEGSDFMDPTTGAATAKHLAESIKQLAREHGTQDIHLAYQGPFGLAVLLGRLLNTFRTHVYEFEDTGDRAEYELMFTLQLGRPDSPIIAVPGEPKLRP